MKTMANLLNLLPMRLNPCYSGICSVNGTPNGSVMNTTGLNPCYSGICSVNPPLKTNTLWMQYVLILVIVEYAL